MSLGFSQNKKGDERNLDADSVPSATSESDTEYRRLTDSDRYAAENARARNEASRRRSLVTIAISCIAILGCIAYMVFLFNSDHTASSALAVSIDEQRFGISNEDMEMLAAEGYNGETLTEDAGAFMQKFFTFDKGSVDDGSWEASYQPYVAENDIVDIMENLLYIRGQKSWSDVFEEHPYYKSKWVSNNSITWHILPTDTVNVPYCDIYSVIDCTPIEKYFANSPDLEINRYLNCYRIVFDVERKITSIKKIRSFTLQFSIDEDAMKADKDSIEKAQETQRQKEEMAAKEEAAAETEERARQEAAAAEEAQKAEEERKAREAEEKAEKEAEKKEEANKHGNGNANSNTDKNENIGSGASNDNTNSAGNSTMGGDNNNNANSNENMDPGGDTEPVQPENPPSADSSDIDDQAIG